MGKQKDMFDPQMEIGDELIERGLPTHIQPNSSSMDPNSITLIRKQGDRFRMEYPDGASLGILAGITDREADELAKRWNAHRPLKTLLRRALQHIPAAGDDDIDLREEIEEALKK